MAPLPPGSQPSANGDPNANGRPSAPSSQSKPRPRGIERPVESETMKALRLFLYYAIAHGTSFIMLPVIAFVAVQASRVQLGTYEMYLNEAFDHRLELVAAAAVLLVVAIMYLANRPRSVYLVDFGLYSPPKELEVTMQLAVQRARESGFDDSYIQFQKKVFSKSGLGNRTCLSPGLLTMPMNRSMKAARDEAEMVMFGAMDEMFRKTGIKPRDISILIVNCSIFCPTPSMSAMLVNHYKMRPDILSYQLGGMGCSAGLISIKLARDLLQVFPGKYAVVVSTENITQNLYDGNRRDMQVPNCLFRIGAAAVLLTNKWSESWRSKYQLSTVIRTHHGHDDKAYKCVYQEEDEDGYTGVSLSKDLMNVAGNCLKDNLTVLGPQVLPLSEKLLFAGSFVARKVFGLNVKQYQPDFKLAFEHFCIHAGGRAVLDELEKGLNLDGCHVEASRMSLYRFGNTSSSTIWYELSYTEAKGRVRKGDRICQIAFGSGFKCNSAAWRALRTVPAKKNLGPWADCIDELPVEMTYDWHTMEERSAVPAPVKPLSATA